MVDIPTDKRLFIPPLNVIALAFPNYRIIQEIIYILRMRCGIEIISLLVLDRVSNR